MSQLQQRQETFRNRRAGGGGGGTGAASSNDPGNIIMNNSNNNNNHSSSTTTHPLRSAQHVGSSSNLTREPINNDVLAGGLTQQENVIARLDGIARLMNENNSLLQQLLRKIADAETINVCSSDNSNNNNQQGQTAITTTTTQQQFPVCFRERRQRRVIIDSGSPNSNNNNNSAARETSNDRSGLSVLGENSDLVANNTTNNINAQNQSLRDVKRALVSKIKDQESQLGVDVMSMNPSMIAEMKRQAENEAARQQRKSGNNNAAPVVRIFEEPSSQDNGGVKSPEVTLNPLTASAAAMMMRKSLDSDAVIVEDDDDDDDGKPSLSPNNNKQKSSSSSSPKKKIVSSKQKQPTAENDEIPVEDDSESVSDKESSSSVDVRKPSWRRNQLTTQQHHISNNNTSSASIPALRVTAGDINNQQPLQPGSPRSDLADLNNGSSGAFGRSGLTLFGATSAANAFPKKRQVVRKLDEANARHGDDGETLIDDTPSWWQTCCVDFFETYTIDPESWTAFILDLTFIMCGFCLAIVTITFLLYPSENLDFKAAIATTVICQFLTIVWVVSRFFVQSRGRMDESPFATYSPELEWEVCDKPEIIRSKYLSFWFYFDLLYAVPIEFAFVFEQKWFFYAMIRHVLRLVRIRTVGKSANPLVEDRTGGMLLAAYACVCGILLHFVACLFCYIENDNKNNNYDFLDGLHWAVQLFSSVGATEVRLSRQGTQVLSILAAIAGIAVVGLSAGIATQLLTEKDSLEEEQAQAKKMMESMLRHFGIPWNLQKEIILLFPAVLKAQSESQFRDMIRVLPSFLGEQVEGYLRAKMLAKVPLFAGLDEKIVLKLSKTLEQAFVAPFEYIIQSGEQGSEMFFLVHGVVEILVPINDEEECPVATLRSGSYFGEIALIEDSARTASVQAVTACDILVLDKAVFRDVVAQHVELQERIQQEISKRRGEIEKKQKASEKHNRKRSMRISSAVGMDGEGGFEDSFHASPEVVVASTTTSTNANFKGVEE